jgi:hypothetical protein
MKRRTMVVEDAMFEGGFERRDVRVTFPADMTVEEALQAGILLATEFMIHSDCGGFTHFELRDLGVNWMCMRSAAEDAELHSEENGEGKDLEFESGITFSFHEGRVRLERIDPPRVCGTPGCKKTLSHNNLSGICSECQHRKVEPPAPAAIQHAAIAESTLPLASPSPTVVSISAGRPVQALSRRIQ